MRLETDGGRIARSGREWLLAEPKTVFLKGGLGSAGSCLEIRVEHPAMENGYRAPLRPATDGTGIASLRLPEEGPFGMAKVSIHIKGQNRALYRCRFWYWPGLMGLRDGRVFDARSIPNNVAIGELEYIHQQPDGLLSLDTERPYMRARLTFDVGQRTISFAFPPPGVSVFVRTSAGVERPLSVGARLKIAGDLASYLVIRSDDQAFAIDCKGEIERYPFDKSGLWRKPFAALERGGKHNVVRVLRSGSADDTVDIVRIAADPPPLREPGITDELSPARELRAERTSDQTLEVGADASPRVYVLGSSGRRLLDIGSRLEIGAHDAASRLVVECTDRSADIDFAGEIIHRPFVRGSWSIGLNTVNRRSQLVVRLRPLGRPYDSIVLLRLGPARRTRALSTAGAGRVSRTRDSTSPRRSTRAPARRVVGEPERRPRLVIDGCKVARNTQGWLIAEPKSLFLRDWDHQEDLLEVSVDHPGRSESLPVPVRRGSSNELVARLPLPVRGRFGLARISVHMRYHLNDPLARCRFWYWPSLKGLRGCVFDAVSVPENIAKPYCRHIQVAGGKVSLSADADHLCHLAFEVDHKIVTFVLRGRI